MAHCPSGSWGLGTRLPTSGRLDPSKCLHVTGWTEAVLTLFSSATGCLGAGSIAGASVVSTPSGAAGLSLDSHCGIYTQIFKDWVLVSLVSKPSHTHMAEKMLEWEHLWGEARNLYPGSTNLMSLLFKECSLEW